jgi:thiamine pyrophosphate-dependent acetolactate synthase large subunit-like protein
MDFRLGFGAVFGQDTQLIVADRVQPEREHPRPIAAGLYGDLSATLTVLSETPRAQTAVHEEWVADLRATEIAARRSEQGELADDRSPLHPMRVYAELAPMLDRDAIIVVDAGDFGSYAGRVIDSHVRAHGWTAARSAAWARAPVMRWPPSWPALTGRWCCCRATAPSDSAAWSGTRWYATTFPWSR